MKAELIARLLMVLTGFVLAMLGVITFIHSDHNTLGILILLVVCYQCLRGCQIMSNYIWCHGPNCHERPNNTRVRGVKGSKVLRTVKIALNNYRANRIWKYFCDQTCMHDFIKKHIEEFVQLHPRPDALETPIEDPVKETIQSNWGNYSWTKQQ